MCCLFGLIDPNHAYTGKQKAKMLHVLATASEARGTDATGYALNTGNKLYVYKRPIAGHKLQFRIRDDTTVVMGHTRMTTKGDQAQNENNHPFLGNLAGRPFALAHNGVLWNDKDLRQELKLPKTKIETDQLHRGSATGITSVSRFCQPEIHGRASTGDIYVYGVDGYGRAVLRSWR